MPDSPGPALFRQERVGARRRPFRILKFRTARDALSSGPVLTVGRGQSHHAVGAVLRRSKLDELPQLINVLEGGHEPSGSAAGSAEVRRALYPPEVRELVLSVRPGHHR